MTICGEMAYMLTKTPRTESYDAQKKLLVCLCVF